jgi:hypothetical protein
MRVRGASTGLKRLTPFALVLWAGSGLGQNQPPTNSHVIIPNPTPRDPDLKQVYDGDADGQRKVQVQTIQSQLRAREIWLASNQILLLAQQLQEEVGPGKKSLPMTMNAAKVARIEKLAHSVGEKMKDQ